MTAPVCPDHHIPTTLVDDSLIYGRSYGRAWVCPNYLIGCRWYVGAHKHNGAPKGSLANDAIRQARINAHSAFDGWWRREGVKRNRAYRELAERLGIHPHQAHIATMDVDQCARVVELFR